MISSCVYRVNAALIEALDAKLGPPLDSYVRGWQVWLEPHGPGGETLEWRLHPPAGFEMPEGVDPHDLFEVALGALSDSDDPDRAALRFGKELRTLASIWEVLEVFPTFGDDIAAREVAAIAEQVLDRRPDVAGTVDHGRLGDQFKARRGGFSIGRALLEELDPLPVEE